jgi:uncharacterized protein with HEPN domain
MPARSLVPRLTDMIEAIARVRQVVGDLTVDVCEADWEERWLVERGVEIVSEASLHLTAELKARHPEIPWKNVADIGKVLRHTYQGVAAPTMWKLVREHLPRLEMVCRVELKAALGDQSPSPQPRSPV